MFLLGIIISFVTISFHWVVYDSKKINSEVYLSQKINVNDTYNCYWFYKRNLL